MTKDSRFWTRRLTLAPTLLLLAASGCGGDDASDSAGSADAGVVSTPAADASTPSAGPDAAAAASTDSIPVFNGCAAASYVDKSGASDARTVDVGATGLNFSPTCLTIAAGQTVHFQGSLSAHPLAPGSDGNPTAGSNGSPIVVTSAGSAVDFTFPTAGTFPYVCTAHSSLGMVGSIHVK